MTNVRGKVKGPTTEIRTNSDMRITSLVAKQTPHQKVV